LNVADPIVARILQIKEIAQRAGKQAIGGHLSEQLSGMSVVISSIALSGSAAANRIGCGDSGKHRAAVHSGMLAGPVGNDQLGASKYGSRLFQPRTGIGRAACPCAGTLRGVTHRSDRSDSLVIVRPSSTPVLAQRPHQILVAVDRCGQLKDLGGVARPPLGLVCQVVPLASQL
jgi:hypothetical protein